MKGRMSFGRFVVQGVGKLELCICKYRSRELETLMRLRSGTGSGGSRSG